MLQVKTFLTSTIAASALALPVIGFAGGNQAFEQENNTQSQAAQSATGPGAYSGMPLAEALKKNGKFSTFMKALEAADMTWVIAKGGQHTVFAPTDEAFNKIPAKDMEALLRDKPRLQKVLSYHIAPNVSYAWNDNREQLTAMNGEALKLKSKSDNAAAKVNSAEMTAQISASNGTLYGISEVLWPKT